MKSAIGMKIKKKCHVSSTAAVKEILPYIRIIFENNPEMRVGIAKWLDLDDAMVEYLVHTKNKRSEAAVSKTDV